MKTTVRGILGLALVAFAVPALAGENDCVATTDPTLGQRLTDQFIYEEGLGAAPAPFVDEIRGALSACIEMHAVPDQHQLVFTELNVGFAMKDELAKRLRAAGTDVGMLDRSMIPHIPSVATTFDEMFNQLGPEFEGEAQRLVASGLIDAELIDLMLGAYSGAFHSTYVSQLQWDARN